MKVVLVSTYELGHQPLHLASPAAALMGAGHQVRCLDLSCQDWDQDLFDWADAVAFSVPMHTAMRVAMAAARRLRRQIRPKPVCFYGLYAHVSAELTIGPLADRAVAGEYTDGLLQWLCELVGSPGSTPPVPVRAPSVQVSLTRRAPDLPARGLLPPLERYARMVHAERQSLVGYVEASRGCSHRCRHCPVPVVYDGRTRAVESDAVLADINQLVAMGAGHITFGDPDFLNRPWQSLKIAEEMHASFPDLTFDFTAKVEHILRYRELMGTLSQAGCLFAVTAVESVSNQILQRLDKGHSAADAGVAVGVLREHAIEPRPSFVPFTPWTQLDDVAHLVEFVVAHQLVANVDPVQYSIRLLVPDGSLLIGQPGMRLGPYRPDLLGYSWTSADPRVDQLQSRLEAIASSGIEAPVYATFREVRAAVGRAAGKPWTTDDPVPESWKSHSPHLTEPWFCCAEPTTEQFRSVTTGV